jgi:hypothetical protein
MQQGVTVDIASIVPGSTVSNTVTLAGDVSCLAGPWLRVELSVSNNVTHSVTFITTITNKNAAPTNVFVY